MPPSARFLQLRDHNFDTRFPQSLDVFWIRARVGYQNVDVGHGTDIGKALRAKLTVIGQRDPGLGRSRDHLLDLCLGVVCGGDSIRKIDCADSQNRFVQPDFGERTLRPFAGKIECVLLQIAPVHSTVTPELLCNWQTIVGEFVTTVSRFR